MIEVSKSESLHVMEVNKIAQVSKIHQQISTDMAPVAGPSKLNEEFQVTKDPNTNHCEPIVAKTDENFSTNGQPRLDAVIIRDLTYEIGRGRARKVILNKISLTVPEGSM